MSVKLTLEIEGAVGPDDKDILTGATMILMALTQKAIGEDAPEAEPEEDPQPCGDLEMESLAGDPGGPFATGKVCISEVGHKGRHKYRNPIFDIKAMTTEGLN